jgi:thiamine-phosphate diphosphorylase
MALTAQDLRLYLITDPGLCADLGVVNTARRAVSGGVTMVQLRDKHASTAQRVELALALKQALAGTGVPLLVNDDVEAAVQADVDGAHIGQSDGNPERARALLGPDRILGLSCETVQRVQDARSTPADYLGLGPVFATATKSDHKAPIGFDGLATLAQASHLPTVAIGGLNASHVAPVLTAGADGLSVISAICGQPDPEQAARAFFSSDTGAGA